jgi:monooxygenase
MFTLSYLFKPWRDPKAIADGPSILAYIRETAAEFGIDRHVRYNTKVVAADFSTAESRWTLTLAHRGQGRHTTLTCRFLYSCAGYYDYDQGHSPEFPGIAGFAGTVVHPQFWPEDLGYAGKKVVVIGSGATAVTLVPAMAGTAAHVTMLQRSPAWIGAVPAWDAPAGTLRKLLPPDLAYKLARAKNITFTMAFYQYCRHHPARAASAPSPLREPDRHGRPGPRAPARQVRSAAGAGPQERRPGR